MLLDLLITIIITSIYKMLCYKICNIRIIFFFSLNRNSNLLTIDFENFFLFFYFMNYMFCINMRLQR